MHIYAIAYKVEESTLIVVMEKKELRKIVWIGSSHKDLCNFPEPTRREAGYILDRVQRGIPDKNIKVLKGFSGVQEICIDFDKDTYRVVYALKLGENIYVLHAFKKKSKKGDETPKQDIDIIKSRLKTAKEDAENDKGKR